MVERAEVANLRALAAVDALVLVPVDLPVGFGIDETGAGLTRPFYRPYYVAFYGEMKMGKRCATSPSRPTATRPTAPVRERAPHFKRYDPI